MTRLQTELAHLLALAAPPYRKAWSDYVKNKAQVMANWQPDLYADLPRLLEEAMRSPSSTASTTDGAVASPIKSSGSAEPA